MEEIPAPPAVGRQHTSMNSLTIVTLDFDNLAIVFVFVFGGRQQTSMNSLTVVTFDFDNLTKKSAIVFVLGFNIFEKFTVKVAAEAFPALCSHSRRVSPRRGSVESYICNFF